MYPQTCEADRLFNAEIDADVANPDVALVTPAAVASGETAEVRPADVARPERSDTARVLVPREEIVALISSFRSLPTLPAVEILDVR